MQKKQEMSNLLLPQKNAVSLSFYCILWLAKLNNTSHSTYNRSDFRLDFKNRERHWYIVGNEWEKYTAWKVFRKVKSYYWPAFKQDGEKYSKMLVILADIVDKDSAWVYNAK